MSISDTLKAQKYASIAEIAAAQSKLYADKLESAPDYASQAATSASLAATSATQAESAALTSASAANSATSSALSAANSAEAAGEAAADAIQNYVDQSVRVPGSETINPVPESSSRANSVFLWDGASQPTGKLLSEFATLDGTGKIPVSMIPAIALTEPFVVSSQAAMLALNAQIGDIAKRTDLGYSFCLASAPPSTLSNWVQLTDDVLAQLGLSSGATMIGAVDDSSNPTTVQGALNLKTSIASLAASTGSTLIGATNNAGSTSTAQSVLNLKLEKTELSANDGDKYVGECPTIAILRATEPTYDKQRITLREHTAGTGKGGGQFRSVLSGASYTDNNGTVIKTVGGSAWIRVNADILNPLMFGAVPYTDASSPTAHTAIMAACNAAAGTVDLLGYTYRTSDEIYVNQTRPIHLRDGKIRPDNTIPNVFRVLNSSHRINGITIIGDGSPGNVNGGINVMSNSDGAIVENCRISNLGSLAIATASKKNIARNNYIDNVGYASTGNFRASIWMNEGEHNVMEGNVCQNCNWGIIMRNEIGVTQGYYNTMRNNIVIASSSAATDSQGISASAQLGLTTSGNIIRNFIDNSIDHQNCFGVNIVNNQITGNKDGVFIGDRSCGRIIISGNNITGCPTGIRYYNPSGTPFPSQTFSDVQITNNTILSSTFTGIWVNMAGGGTNYMTRVDGNIVDIGGAGGLGIVLDSVTTGSACNNQVRRANGHGIDVRTCDGLRITNNTVIDCGYGTTGTYNGINLGTCSRCNASDNYIIGTSMVYGIVLNGGSVNMSYTNHARGTTGATAVSIVGGSGNVEANNIKS